MKNAVLKLANVVGDAGCFRFLCPEAVPVFMLHRVYDGESTIAGGISAEVLRAHLSYLSTRGYRVLTMDELFCIMCGEGSLDSKSVMFTIDDGFADQYEIASRVFDEFGFALNFFVITRFLDGDLWPWDVQIIYAFFRSPEQNVEVILPSGDAYSIELAGRDPRVSARKLRDVLKTGPQDVLYDWIRLELFKRLRVQFPADVPPPFKAMSWADARSLLTSGHGVYPHTLSHRILTTLSSEERQSEIHESAQRIQNELGSRPYIFAYPTGRKTDYDQTDVDQLKRCGFKMAFTTVPGYVQRGQTLLELPRFSVPTNPDDFRQIVNRFEAFKYRFRA